MRVVNQLLTEMDGLETRRQVFIMAATNRPGTRLASVRPEPVRVTRNLLNRAETLPAFHRETSCFTALHLSTCYIKCPVFTGRNVI